MTIPPLYPKEPGYKETKEGVSVITINTMKQLVNIYEPAVFRLFLRNPAIISRIFSSTRIFNMIKYQPPTRSISGSYQPQDT